MKKLMMVLPLAVLLAYCSGPNNTQTTTDTDMDDASVSASTTGTTTTSDATASTDVSDVNTNTGTTSGSTIGTASTTTSSTSPGTSANSSISTTGTIPSDPSDPMYQHWQRTNAQYWTWDMDYPGYDRPTAGSFNSAINGDWQLVMTPELVSAWRQDNSRSLWSSGYAYNGTYLGGNTYLSASESFNNRNSSMNMGTNTTGVSGSTTISGTTGGTISGSTTGSAGVSGTTSGTLSGSTGTTGSTTISGTTGSSSTNGSLNGSTDLSGTSSISTSMDVNSISYNAANGNMYQLPKFNLFLDNGSFTGYTGCNGISGRVQVTGSSLRFLNTTPSTNIDCLGGLDQTVLLDMLRRVDSYAYVGNELQLLQGNQVLLRFQKGSTDTGLH